MDETKLNTFVQQSVFHAATVLLGDRLGLYKAMAAGQPMTPAEVAARAGADERYVAEWLCAQAASEPTSPRVSSAEVPGASRVARRDVSR